MALTPPLPRRFVGSPPRRGLALLHSRHTRAVVPSRRRPSRRVRRNIEFLAARGSTPPGCRTAHRDTPRSGPARPRIERALPLPSRARVVAAEGSDTRAGFGLGQRTPASMPGRFRHATPCSTGIGSRSRSRPRRAPRYPPGFGSGRPARRLRCHHPSNAQPQSRNPPAAVVGAPGSIPATRGAQSQRVSTAAVACAGGAGRKFWGK